MDENSTPIPVDTNRLKNILNASRNIMKKVETGDYETGNIDSRALNEDGIKQMQAEGYSRPISQTTSNTSSSGYNEEMVRNSKLPDSIKEIMIKKPIPKLSGPNHTFNLKDVMDEEPERPMGVPQRPKTQPKRQIAESYVDSDNITISKTELAEMVSDLVNEKLLEFFVQHHNKRITEDAVKKTISLLLKEGKIKKTV